jgi:hypothetical protein
MQNLDCLFSAVLAARFSIYLSIYLRDKAAALVPVVETCL